MTTKADVAAWVAGYDRDFNQLCVALVFQAIKRFGTNPGTSYPDANAAFRAAHIDGTDMDHAPGGAIGYHSGGAHGDVSISMGDGTWLHASAHFSAGEMLRPGDHVGFLTDAEYRRRSGYAARGWSHNFGSHPSFTVAAVNLDPDQGHGTRVVAAAIGRVRVSPTLSGAVGRQILKGHTVGLLGFVRGDVTASSSIWFALTGGGYAHSSLFTDTTTSGLADLDPAPPVVIPPVVPDPPVELPPVETNPTEPAGDAPVTTPTEPTKPPKTGPTKAELDAAVEALKAAGANVSAGLPGNVLAGLFTGHVAARRRTYFAYAIAAFLISCASDLVLYSIITGSAVAPFVAWVSFAGSVVAKAGVALGLVAASNTK